MISFNMLIFLTCIFTIAGIVSFICMFIFLNKEGGEKSAKLNAIITIICLILTSICMLNTSIPSPSIYQSNNKNQNYNDGGMDIIIDSEIGNLFLKTYYSLDGTDPQNGIKYENTIHIFPPATVIAKNKFLWGWSKPEECYFFDYTPVDEAGNPIKSFDDDSEDLILEGTFNFLRLNDNEKFIQVDTNIIVTNVREYPYLNSSIITQIPCEDKYKIEDKVINNKNEIWYKIVVDKKTKGYVYGDYVKIIQ